MSKHHLTATAVFLGLALGAAPVAWAQSGTSDHARNSSASSGSSATETIKPNQMRASKVLNSTVYDRDNQDIGSVKDLVLDKDGKVADVVIGVGGFLGVGEKNVAVPLSQIKMDNNRLTLDRSKSQLQEAANYRLEDRDTGAGSSSVPVTGGRAGSSSAPAGTNR